MRAFGDLPFEFIEAGKEITQRNRIPFYLHIGEVSNFPAKRSQTRRAFALLTEGDIATHIYSNDHGRILDTDGRVVPEALEAHERGVIFDIGFGVGNFSYPLAERAMEQGIHTDTISSDQNSLCAKARADLPATMTRFLILGMPLEDIVERVTCAPARAVGLSDRGRLSVGARADITVFRVDSAEQMLDDADGVARTTDRVIVPISVYKDGVRHACCVDRVYEGDNFRMKVRPARVPAALEFDAEERSFLRGLFAEMERFTQKEWSGVAIHSAMDRVLAETGVPRKKALHAIYRVVLTPESFGFTPQIGPVLARMGREEVLAYREGLRGQLG
ncbi:MAG: amidohydrolase family protein [Burkholderiaceae bacterium]